MDLRDPAALFQRSYDRQAGGLVDYVIVIVATVVAVVAGFVLYGAGGSAALGLPFWMDVGGFLVCVGLVWVVGLQATALLVGRR